ncbi:hypothetical protein BGZ72_008839 [Mortierella alpina]|nr:hypothetical protein BGZ72_008839 [Mortierella alpina]
MPTHPIKIQAMNSFLADMNRKLDAGKEEIAADRTMSQEMKAKSRAIFLEEARKARLCNEVLGKINETEVELLRRYKFWWPTIDVDKAIAAVKAEERKKQAQAQVQAEAQARAARRE